MSVRHTALLAKRVLLFLPEKVMPSLPEGYARGVLVGDLAVRNSPVSFRAGGFTILGRSRIPMISSSPYSHTKSPFRI
jgi:hypothetical protein